MSKMNIVIELMKEQYLELEKQEETIKKEKNLLKKSLKGFGVDITNLVVVSQSETEKTEETTPESNTENTGEPVPESDTENTGEPAPESEKRTRGKNK